MTPAPALVALLLGCGTAQNQPQTPANAPALEILYQSRGEGEIEPCG